MTRLPINCKCSGTWRSKRLRWVVLVRGDKKSMLKCLACGWKWFSKRQYVATLRDHTEESRRGMTDADILARLRDKTLRVDLNTAQVWSCLDNHGRASEKWTELRTIERQASDGQTYRFVEVCSRGKKKKIAKHRLVWMARNWMIPPDGCDVDHIQGEHDGISNLRLLPSGLNRATNGARQYA